MIDTDKDVDYRLISVLMMRLPQNGKWTKAKREKWLQAVTAAVTLLTEVTDEESDG